MHAVQRYKVCSKFAFIGCWFTPQGRSRQYPLHVPYTGVAFRELVHRDRAAGSSNSLKTLTRTFLARRKSYSMLPTLRANKSSLAFKEVEVEIVKMFLGLPGRQDSQTQCVARTS